MDRAKSVAEAKKDETWALRIATIRPMIIAGSGLNDRYKGA